MSIYGGHQFADENFKLLHDGPGFLAMVMNNSTFFLPNSWLKILTFKFKLQANSGKDTNGCQFYITCTNCKFLDNKHVVFGRVIDGLLVMRKIENVPTGVNNKPKIPVIISQCGQM